MVQPVNTEHPQVRVLLIDLSNHLGGASIRTLNLLHGMKQGHVALAGLQGSPVTERALKLGLEVYSVGKNKLDLSIVKNLLQLAKTKGFILFDTQNPQSKFWGSIAGLLAGVRIVSTLNSWYLNEHKGRWRGWFYHFIERSTMPWTDMFISVSVEIQNNLQQYNIDSHRLALIPNAINFNMNFSHKNREWLSAQFNIPYEAIVCVAVGRLVEAKGYTHLINALSLLDSNIYCLIIGEGHLKPQLMTQIKNLKLDKRIQLIGFRHPEELLTIVELADIYVMSSITEGTPLSLLEACALAKPIVSTEAGGIPDIFNDKEHALLVTSGNAQQLADAILWMTQHQTEAQHMAMAGNAHIRKHFSLEAQVSATLGTYKRTLDH